MIYDEQLLPMQVILYLQYLEIFSSRLFCLISSNTTSWWVKVDATREVCIAPLCERSLLFEVFLDRRKILLLHQIMIDLIGCLEGSVYFSVVGVVSCLCRCCPLRVSQLFITQDSRLCATTFRIGSSSCVSRIYCWQTTIALLF